MMQKTMKRAEEKIAELLKYAKKQKKNAEKAKIERYFEGQIDVLKQMLVELAESGDDVAQDAEDSPQVLSLKEKIAEALKHAKKQKKNAKKAKDVQYFKGQRDVLTLLLSELKGPQEKSVQNVDSKVPSSVKKPSEISPASSETEALLNEALSKEIITRKTSYYFHDSFPTGKAHGKSKTLDLLNDGEIAAAILEQLVEAEN